MTRRMPPDPARHFATPETEDPMEPTAFLVEGRDNTRLGGYRWVAQAPARGVVVLAHGLGEHALRYAHLAQVLAAEGFDVVAGGPPGPGATPGTDGGAGAF